MPNMKKIWDRSGKEGPVEVEMISIDADEAMRNDPKRYGLSPDAPPEGAAPAAAPVAAAAAEAADPQAPKPARKPRAAK